MKFLLDTNLCIAHLRAKSDALQRRLVHLQNEDLVVCSIVRAELFAGAFKSEQQEENMKAVEKLIAPFPSLSFDDKAAFVYAKIRTALEKAGKLIGPHDLQIAAITIANDLILITHNVAEFSRIPELRIEDWEAA